MIETVIRVAEVSKLYHLGQPGHCHSLRETLAGMISGPFRALAAAANGRSRVDGESQSATRPQGPESIWALRDVSFEINKGETIGIIGPNGSGKSTLLKLLAQITEPTEGEIYLNGRVTALIELGAGFHPELTGRENIYLNGAILGMNGDEINAKFDEIVDFAGLADFIETPVKHYSNGMTVRLGFSLAVSVDPDILLVDEVLAVGDADFKRRCFEKMDSFIKAGKTVILVTHNLQEVERMARRIILIDHGFIQCDGLPADVIARYASFVTPSKPWHKNKNKDRNIEETARAPIEITKVQMCDGEGFEKFNFNTHDELQIIITYIAHRLIVNPMFRVQIYRRDGLLCHGTNTVRHGIDMGNLCGEGVLRLRYSDLGLLRGDYSCHIAVFAHPDDDFPLVQVVTARQIHVESLMVEGGGVFAMRSEWILEHCQSKYSGSPMK